MRILASRVSQPPARITLPPPWAPGWPRQAWIHRAAPLAADVPRRPRGLSCGRQRVVRALVPDRSATGPGSGMRSSLPQHLIPDQWTSRQARPPQPGSRWSRPVFTTLSQAKHGQCRVRRRMPVSALHLGSGPLPNLLGRPPAAGPGEEGITRLGAASYPRARPEHRWRERYPRPRSATSRRRCLTRDVGLLRWRALCSDPTYRGAAPPLGENPERSKAADSFLRDERRACTCAERRRVVFAG